MGLKRSGFTLSGETADFPWGEGLVCKYLRLLEKNGAGKCLVNHFMLMMSLLN